MVYESDFYTTRRPYRTSPAYSTYTTSKREIPWEKVPFVPRPSLVPDPITAFGPRRPAAAATTTVRKSILDPAERAKIKPKQLLEPVQPYMSARDQSRERILTTLRRQEAAAEARLPSQYQYGDSMDVILPRLHKVAEQPNLPYKRRIVASSDFLPSYY